MGNSLRTKGLAFLSVGTTLTILGFVLYQGRDALLTYDWNVNWSIIALAFFVMVVTFAIVALMWVSEMQAVGSKLPRSAHLNYYIASHLIRRLPGTLWYIAGRGYLYRQQGESARLVAVVSSLEMVMLTTSGAIVTLFLWGTGFGSLHVGYLFVLILVLITGILLMQPKTSQRILRTFAKADVPRLGYARLLIWLFFYSIAWFGSGLVFFLLTNAFAGLGIEHMLYVIGCWTLIGALSTVVFFLPSNFGFTEIGLSMLLGAIVPVSVAVMIALVARITLTIFDVVSVLLWFAVDALWRRFIKERTAFLR